MSTQFDSFSNYKRSANQIVPISLSLVAYKIPLRNKEQVLKICCLVLTLQRFESYALDLDWTEIFSLLRKGIYMQLT